MPARFGFRVLGMSARVHDMFALKFSMLLGLRGSAWSFLHLPSLPRFVSSFDNHPNASQVRSASII